MAIDITHALHVPTATTDHLAVISSARPQHARCTKAPLSFNDKLLCSLRAPSPSAGVRANAWYPHCPRQTCCPLVTQIGQQCWIHLHFRMNATAYLKHPNRPGMQMKSGPFFLPLQPVSPTLQDNWPWPSHTSLLCPNSPVPKALVLTRESAIMPLDLKIKERSRDATAPSPEGSAIIR